MIENISHSECLELVKNCDLFLGQFVWGENGMAEIEAMALGKPVLCYINHDKETGVIPCDPELIHEWIKAFITNPKLMVEEGFKARAWIENQNELDTLINIYKQAIYDKKSIHNSSEFLNYQENKYKLFPELYFKENY